MIDGTQELEKFLTRKSLLFETGLLNLLRARFGQGSYSEALGDLAGLIRNTIILANLNGRKRALMESDRASKADFSDLSEKSPIVYGLEFIEAVEDILTREPRVVPPDARHRAMEWVSNLYSEAHAFAAAKSVSDKLTHRVQDIIERSIRGGMGVTKAESEIVKASVEEAQPWTRAYANTVYVTNAGNAYNAGRFEQAKDPDVREVIKAIEVVGIADDAERENHRYARGLIASQDDSVWTERHARPPYGYNCRHGLKFVSKFTLERMGLLAQNGSVIRREPPGFEKFRPDAGFGRGEF